MAKKSKIQEEVTLFGEKMPDQNRTRDSGNMVWGVLIVSAGIILLANNFGIVDWRFWEAIVFLWPFLLVLFGLQILLGHTLLARLAMLVISLSLVITAILFGLKVINSPYSPQLPSPIDQLLNSLEDYYESAPNPVRFNSNHNWR